MKNEANRRLIERAQAILAELRAMTADQRHQLEQDGVSEEDLSDLVRRLSMLTSPVRR